MLLFPTAAQAKPCGTYTRADYHKASRTVHRDSHRTRREERRLHRVFVCQARPRKSRPILRVHARRYKAAWHRRYYWTIRWRHVDPGVKARLANLRSCESTNNPRATNGSHWGYYQYDVRTWYEAQSWAGVPRSRLTARADYAAPIVQNVVTASFFPANTGRWACSA